MKSLRNPTWIRPLALIATAFFAALGCQVTPEVFVEDIELDEAEMSVDGFVGTATISPVERERKGLRVAFGETEATVWTALYTEKFDEDFDGYGASFGVRGTPKPYEINNDVGLIVPYSVAMNLSFADAEESVNVSGQNVDVESDLWYLEVAAEGGVGIDIHGIQPSVGIVMSSLYGRIDASGSTGSGSASIDGDLTALNLGGFLQVRYAPEDIPIRAEVRALGGDIKGLSFSLGVSF